MDRTLILDSEQIDRKITRMAHHIYENNYKEKELILVGMLDRGFLLSQRLAMILSKISDVKIRSHSLQITELKGERHILFSGEPKDLKNKAVILIDDVLNSGRTLIEATSFLLEAKPKKIATATLVDRIHRRYPIRADYVGLSLSTNLREHVAVEIGNGTDAVYLE